MAGAAAAETSGADISDNDLASEPVPYGELYAELPEKEDVAFKAVRYNDLTTIERRLREGLDIDAKHEGKCTEGYYQTSFFLSN